MTSTHTGAPPTAPPAAAAFDSAPTCCRDLPTGHHYLSCPNAHPATLAAFGLAPVYADEEAVR